MARSSNQLASEIPPPPIEPPPPLEPPPPPQPPNPGFDRRTDNFHVAFEHRSNSASKAIIATWYSWEKFHTKVLHHASKHETVRQMFLFGLQKAKASDANTIRIRASDPFIFLLQQVNVHSANIIDSDIGIFNIIKLITQQGRNLIFEYVVDELNCHCQELATATFDDRQAIQIPQLHSTETFSTFTAQQIYEAAVRTKHQTWRSLPSHCISNWVQLISNVAQAEHTPSQSEALLVCAPVIFLRRSSAPTIEALSSHLATAASSKAVRNKIILEFLMAPVFQTSHPPGNVSRKVEKLVALGGERKAIQLLEREHAQHLNPSLNSTVSKDDLSEIQKLFPPLKEQLSHSTATVISPLSAKKFSTALRRLARASAPGPDGWTKEILTPLFNGKFGQTSGAKQIIKDSFISILNSIINDCVSSELASFLHHGTLILIPKPNGKKRPIVLSSIISKLAWKTILLEINVKSSLHPSMIHGKLPCQKGIHKGQIHLDHGGAVLQLDATNGFGEIKRATIQQSLFEHDDLACLRPIFNLLYGSNFIATQFNSDGTPLGSISISEGVLQGCAAAPYLFSLGLTHGIKDIVRQNQISMHVVADDIAIFIPENKINELRHVINICSTALGSCGISLNPTKSILVCHPSKTSSIPQNIGIIISSRADYLGGIISSIDEQIPFDELRPKYVARMKAFSHHLNQTVKSSCQVLNLILRYIISCWGYFFSTTKPCTTHSVAERIDIWARNAFCQIHGRQVTDVEWEQLSLLDSDGGNNLTSWKTVSSEIYYATQAVSLSHEAEAHQNIFQLARRITMKQADHFYDRLDVSQPHENPTTTSSQQERSTSHRSRLSMKARSNLIRRAHSESNLHWVAIRPEEKITTISDEQWKINMNLRLLHDCTSTPCCSTYQASSSINDHLLCCNTCSGGLWKIRHQRILHAMALILREASVLMTTTDVVRRFGITRDEGPDGLILLEKSIAIDVTVTHQTENAHYYRPHQRYQEKISKYKHIATILNWDLAPLIFTSHGHPTKPTQKWLKTFAAASSIAGTNRRLQAAMTIATVRGNADIVRLTEAANTLYPTAE